MKIRDADEEFGHGARRSYGVPALSDLAPQKFIPPGTFCPDKEQPRPSVAWCDRRLKSSLEITRDRAADVLNLYFSEAGGLLQARTIAEIARWSGMAVWVGSMPELGLGTAANAHLAAAIPGLELASDVCGFAYHADDILTTPLVVEQGSVAVPTGPGLGVEIDPKALTRLRMEDR
jgi:hypothetical protein